MGAVERGSNYAYATLITRSSYLPGVIVLAHTLQEHGSIYPLVVLYTPSLPIGALRALELEASRSNRLLLHEVEPLHPGGNEPLSFLAERFRDTWTKLRVFDLCEIPCGNGAIPKTQTNATRDDDETVYHRLDLLCYLDADMIMCKNMDSVFHAVSLECDWIAACRDCICNPGGASWAPSYCRPANCPLTSLGDLFPTRQQLQQSAAGYSGNVSLSPELSEIEDNEKIRHFNSGMFLFRPSEILWKKMLNFFSTTPLLPTFKFPDQDFLQHFFQHNWLPLPWHYNACKTLRDRHANIWRDEEVTCLHFVVEKPWAKSIAEDGMEGYADNDVATHRQWWAAFERWRNDRKVAGEDGKEVLQIMTQFVANEDSVETEDMKVIGSLARVIREH